MTQRVKQILLIGLCALVVVVGLVNIIRVRTLPIDIAERDGKIIVERVFKTGAQKESLLKENDVIVKINNRELPSLGVAFWEMEQARPNDVMTLTCQRGDLFFTTHLTNAHPISIGHGILVVVIGVVFLALGLIVWWSVIGDKLVASFLRLNIFTAIAVFLDSLSNVFEPAFFHHAYSLIWMTSYCLIPGALLDFILRFTQKNYPRFDWHALVFYLPTLLLAIALAITFLSAAVTQSMNSIFVFDVFRRTVFGLLMLTYFVITFLVLTYAWLRSARPEDRKCNRWLLLCTFVGIAPFILLHKLPTLWGGMSLISLDEALIFLPVAPIGWGMAVASFRLLRIEWTLSRTIVYVVSAGIVLYAMIILLTFGAGKYKAHDVGAVAALIVVAVFIAYLAGLSLYKGIRSAVDRVYYGDWYNFRDAVQNLSHKLSGSILEHDIVSILTEQFPDLLRIEKAILLIRSDDGTWIPPPQRNAPMVTDFADAVTQLYELLAKSGSGTRAVTVPRHHPLAVWGFTAVLPLVHAERIMGCLLLGRKESQSPYSVRDFQLLDAVSSFAGMALANLELHNELIARECRAVAADLAGGIAHEINNALYPLKGQAQLMTRNMESEEKYAKAANIIVEMSNKIQRIADNLNHLSEPARPNKTRVNLNDIAENAIQILSETAGRIKRFKSDKPDAPFQLKRELNEDIPYIEADSGQINQVFINLILNAADAMETLNHGVLTVGTTLSTDKNFVIGYVEDTGIGIRKEYLVKIFQPYFTTKPKGKGTGFGLAIVHSIIGIHDGKMMITSKEGHGTRMEFALPISSPFA